MAISSAYISEYIQSNFNDKFNRTTDIALYRSHLTTNNHQIYQESESKITLKSSFSSKYEDFPSSEVPSILCNEDRRENPRKNMFEDFRESMATIASKRRVSSDRLLSKTFSQKNPQKFSPGETPFANFYRKNVMASCQIENKTSLVEKNNKNLKKMHRKYNLKLDNESRESEINEKIQKTNPSSRANLQFSGEHNNFTYVKTEPCYPSKKESVERYEKSMQNDAKSNQKAKKRSRVNKVYSMQQTITDHLKSRLDQKTSSNIGTTEEEFESEEISEGENNSNLFGKDPNKLEKCAISEGVVYGKGGIPINSRGKFAVEEEEILSPENKENLKKKENAQKVKNRLDKKFRKEKRL